ncbi:MAG TPA: hypothetical protein VGN17_07060 [Bryobacteraceae bacterium]
MKKLILATILTAAAAIAQTSGTAPKSNPAPAPAATSPAPATTNGKPVVKKHSKVKKNAKPATGTSAAPAVKPANGSQAPAAK